MTSVTNQILVSLNSIRKGDDLIVWDVDGVLVPVIPDVPIREVVTTPDFRNAFLAHAVKYPDSMAILTGRSLEKEVHYILTAAHLEGGLDTLLAGSAEETEQKIDALVEKSDFPGGPEAFHAAISGMAILTGHAVTQSRHGEQRNVPLPADQVRPTKYAQIVGELLLEAQAKAVNLSGEDNKTINLKKVLSLIDIRPQQDRLNINFLRLKQSDLDPKLKHEVLQAIEYLMNGTAEYPKIPVQEKVKSFLSLVGDAVGYYHPGEPLQNDALSYLNSPAGHPQLFEFSHPEKDFNCGPQINPNKLRHLRYNYRTLQVSVDTDNTYLDVKGSSNKGLNLVEWLKHSEFGLLKDNQGIVIVSDQLQKTEKFGSDRVLPEAVIAAGYGNRVKVWQSLDGIDKNPITKNDELYSHLEWAFKTSADVKNFFTLVITTSAEALPELAHDIAVGKFPGISFNDQKISAAPTNDLKPVI